MIEINVCFYLDIVKNPERKLRVRWTNGNMSAPRKYYIAMVSTICFHQSVYLK